MNNPNIHALLLGSVGAYVLYIAWHLLENLLSGAEDIPRAVAIVVIVFFAAAGTAVLIYAWSIWKRGKDNTDPQDKLL